MKPSKRLLSLAAASAISLSISAQELDWAKAFTPTNTLSIYNATVDPAGNLYQTGWFGLTADFDPGPGVYNLTSAGNDDVFISKQDASGNLLWAKSIGNTLTDDGVGITVDGSGNVYVVGYFGGTVDFDPGAGVFNMSTTGSSDIFILKLDASGNFVWAKKVGSTASDYGYDIAVGASGNMYITGGFSGTADFDPGAGVFNMTSAGSVDAFVLKLDAAGNFVWAKRMGGSSTSYGGDIGISIVLDATENVYSSGQFSGTADFDPGTGTFNLTCAGQLDNYYCKLDAAGNFVWAKGIGGTAHEEVNKMVIDAAGNLYSTGCFEGTVDFDPGSGTANLVSAGGWEIFVNKLDASGNYVWAKSWGSTNSNERGSGVAVDAAGNVYSTGVFWGTADFDPGAGVSNITSGGDNDIFLSKLDASGNYVWAYAFGASAASFDYGRTVNIGPAGSIYAAGGFQSTVDFDPGPGTVNLTAPAGLSCPYMLKFNQCTSVSATENITACPPFTWRDGNTYTTSQTGITYRAEGVVIGGCDSVYTLNLTITPNTVALTSSAQADNSCFGSGDGAASVNAATGGSGNYTYEWAPGAPNGDGTTAVSGLTPGTWTCTVTDGNGCQAAQTFTITEPAAITASFSNTSCDAYTWNAQTYTSSGMYTQTLTAANGCDSTVTLNLTITNSTTGVDAITACDSYVWIDGNTYTASNNSATHVLTNSVGCDSTVTLNLTIHNSTSGVDVIAACDSYTWIDGVTYTSSNSSATYLLTNSYGCDSLVTLNLVINNAPAMTATDNGSGTITASAAAAYQWIDCSTNMPIAGATGASFSPVANGTYAVIGYSAQQCADTSNCVVINYLGTTELTTVALNILPNPASNQVTILFNDASATLIIRDVQGKAVSTGLVHSGETLSLQELTAGLYFFELVTPEGKTVKKVVKM